MTAERVKAGDIWLNAELEGPADAPVVVLHHCFGASLAYWDFHLPAFAGYRTLRFDTRGHGASDGPPGDWTLAEMAADVTALLDAFDIPRASICGVSMGGQVAQTFALAYPERLDALMLVNTVSEYGADQRAMWRLRAGEVLEGGIAAVDAAMLSRWFTADAIASRAPGYVYMAEIFRRFRPESFASVAHALSRVHTTPRLPEIDRPALVVGAEKDPGAPKAMTERMAELLPQGRLVWLEPSMHLASLEHPERFNHLIRDFLIEVRPV